LPQVQIHRRDRAEIVNGEGRLIDVTQVTYSTQILPPSTVTIEKGEPSEDEVRAAIQADIDSRTATPAETLDI
jgi:hypothetical protein